MFVLLPKLNTDYYLDNIYSISLLFIFLLLLFVLVLIIKIIILCSEGQSQTDLSESVRAYNERPRNKPVCKHVWQAHYVSIKCGWYMATYEEPCQAKNDISWKCSICQEIRCGTHAQAHYPNNRGPSRNT